ncbi:hypothetical protein TrVE_jg9086 [Triparma verrucosa]|uniref:Radical S-adenosyl methionine domain-containing protein 1, mitochondrial n=1 Tax=Triparma verrucosa TaxID=1606542 RepID=A0A9W7BZ35_9STRA|nr:hypothetical protein TrVE_jg9086 [Triparma verrucosa]
MFRLLCIIVCIFIPSSTSFSLPTPSSYYLHIPFCRRRCNYCDFAIVPIGSSTKSSCGSTDGKVDGKADVEELYRDAIIKEIRTTYNSHQKNARPLKTVYVGGGTPSLMSSEYILSVVGELKNLYGIVEGAEVTIEMDPGTFDLQKMEDLKTGGINRVSLGVQAFDDVVLEEIGRVHRREDVIKSVEIVETCELEWSLDIISGLPGTTLDSWSRTLDTAIELNPSHISVYDLQVEPNTFFGRRYKTTIEDRLTDVKNELKELPNYEDLAEMYRMSSEALRAGGYEHYEVSSFCRPGRRSRHNSNYWGFNAEWLSAGLGSVSCINGRRGGRVREMADYVKWVDGGAVLEEEDEDLLMDYITTGMRTKEGVDLRLIADQFGEDKVKKIVKAVEIARAKGLVEVEEGNRVWLTDPEGMLFSDYVCREIFVNLV